MIALAPAVHSGSWHVLDLDGGEWIADRRGRLRRPRRTLDDALRDEIARQRRIARGLERP